MYFAVYGKHYWFELPFDETVKVNLISTDYCEELITKYSLTLSSYLNSLSIVLSIRKG